MIANISNTNVNIRIVENDINEGNTMNISEQTIESGFETKAEYDKVWFNLVEEIAELDSQIRFESAQMEDDTVTMLSQLQSQLSRKKYLLKMLDHQGMVNTL